MILLKPFFHSYRTRRNFNEFKILALAILTTLLIIGCHYSPFIASSTVSAPVTIKLAGWGANPIEKRLMQQLIQGFEQEHPNIKIKYEIIANQYMDVLKTRLIGEAAADVFYLDIEEAPFLMSRNVLEPLDSYIQPEDNLSDFNPKLLAAFKSNNHLYGIPKDYTTLGLFYNKKAFAEVGLTEPPKTWKELQTYAEKLTLDRNKDGKIDQYGLGIVPELPRQAYVIKAYGGQVINKQGYADFASPDSVAGLQLIVDQYRQSNSTVFPSDVGANSGSEMLGQGKAAMVIEGCWAIPYLLETFPDLQLATAEIPTLNNQPGTMIFTVAYVINRQTKHKAEAWEFISYLTRSKGMEKWTSSGFALPTRQSVAKSLGYDQDPLRSPLVKGVSYGTLWQAGEYLSTISTHFNNQVLSAFLGEQPLDQALRKAQQSANQQIAAHQ